jgi:quercetin dioxygenase-like cupin family protein
MTPPDDRHDRDNDPRKEHAMGKAFHTAHRWDLEWRDDVDVLALGHGVQVKVLYEDPENEHIDMLIKFPPGYVEPRHNHDSSHSVIVLEGLQIAEGEHAPRRVRVGQWRGTARPLRVPGGLRRVRQLPRPVVAAPLRRLPGWRHLIVIRRPPPLPPRRVAAAARCVVVAADDILRDIGSRQGPARGCAVPAPGGTWRWIWRCSD